MIQVLNLSDQVMVIYMPPIGCGTGTTAWAVFYFGPEA